ncbi:MAG: hypothetical protein ABI411_09995 [Tahibacter sp.]
MLFIAMSRLTLPSYAAAMRLFCFVHLVRNPVRWGIRGHRLRNLINHARPLPRDEPFSAEHGRFAVNLWTTVGFGAAMVADDTLLSVSDASTSDFDRPPIAGNAPMLRVHRSMYGIEAPRVRVHRALVGIGPSSHADGIRQLGIDASSGGIGIPEASIGASTSGIGVPQSGIGTSIYDIGIPRSGIGASISDIAMPPPDIGASISGVGVTRLGVDASIDEVGIRQSGIGASIRSDGIPCSGFHASIFLIGAGRCCTDTTSCAFGTP